MVAASAVIGAGLVLIRRDPCRPDRSVTMRSATMAPTLQLGDRVGIRRDVKNIPRGAIVLFHDPSTGGEPGQNRREFVKRVVGLPGETIEAAEGRVLVNGRALDEPYVVGITTGLRQPVTLPSDQYWVMGDNRPNSRDSRLFGPVPGTSITGVAVSVLAPRSRAKPLAENC